MEVRQEKGILLSESELKLEVLDDLAISDLSQNDYKLEMPLKSIEDEYVDTQNYTTQIEHEEFLDDLKLELNDDDYLEVPAKDNKAEQYMVGVQENDCKGYDAVDLKTVTIDDGTLVHQDNKSNECNEKSILKSLLMMMPKNKMILNCKFCAKEFPNNSKLQMHLLTHTGNKQYQCDICLRKFSTKGNLIKHQRLHSGEKRFECDICHKMFRENHQLIAHRHTHTGENPFNCPVCSKGFKVNNQLTQHMIRHNYDQHLLKCKTCNKKFIHHYKLLIHMRKHAGQRPFECNICSRKFKWKGNLTRHQDLHSGENPLKGHMKLTSNKTVIKCDICSRKLSSNYKLQAHMRIHTGENPYECNICLKKFKWKGNLTRHQDLHSGGKPVECDISHETLSENYTLKIHRLTHKLKCKICFKEFNEQAQLKVHMKLHYNDCQAVLVKDIKLKQNIVEIADGNKKGIQVPKSLIGSKGHNVVLLIHKVRDTRSNI